MAGADYRLCDICEAKTFYDARLDYDDGRTGKDGYPIPWWCGDWAVICQECAETHECVVVKKVGPQ